MAVNELRFSLVEAEVREFYASADVQYGVHTLPVQKVSVGGIDLGSEDYDISKHEPHMIDPLSPVEDMYGQQVPIQYPFKPLLTSIITDKRTSDVGSRIEDSKQTAVETIAKALAISMPSLDPVFEDDIFSDQEGSDRNERKAINETDSGIGFIVGDFSEFTFNTPFVRRADIVAVKVNHPIEMEIPAGVGRLVLDGLTEIDTDDEKTLADYNGRIAEYHEALKARIEQAGATCVQIVLDTRLQGRVDPESTDELIAKAITSISK